MSQYFRIGNRVLWNPSNHTAMVFAGMASSVAQAYGSSLTGVTDLGTDEYEISLPEFVGATKLIVEGWSRSLHPLLRGLLAGYLPICLALIARAEQDDDEAIENSGLVAEVVSPCAEADRVTLLRAAHDYRKLMAR